MVTKKKKHKEVMELKVRDVPMSVVEKINKMVEKSGLSREEFLRRQLENIVVASALKEQERTFNEMTKDILTVVNDSNKQIYHLRLMLLGEDVIDKEIT